MPRLAKSSSSAALLNGCIEGDRISSTALHRSVSFKPSNAARLSRNPDGVVSFFNRHSSSNLADTDDSRLGTVTEGQETVTTKQRVQVGDGVKALLASRRKLNPPEKTVSHFKKLKRSLSARLLGNHKSSRRIERQCRSFAIKNHSDQSSTNSSPL
ncbi:unnamed protein product [Haemonchus placei]|uniref:Uncharacterized protein n=1 Tax=Haemonchus placei TaxID=6290 RepID=A0A0N4W5P5_HAEPC|nr:unnamed protein product [Haemonchus placei]